MTDNFIDGMKSISRRSDIKSQNDEPEQTELQSESPNFPLDFRLLTSQNTDDINNNPENKEEVQSCEIENPEGDEDENSVSSSSVQVLEDEMFEKKLEEEIKIIEPKLATPLHNGSFKREASTSPQKPLHIKNENLSFIKSIEPLIKNFGLIIALIAVLLGVYQVTFKKQDSNQKKHGLKFDLIDQLKQKYPNQTDLFWTNIESSFKHSVLKSKDPSIILIVYDQMTEHVYQKISRDIVSHLIKNANLKYDTNDVTINPKTDQNLVSLIQESRVDKSKLYIDAWLDNNFKARRKIVLVEDIQSLPAHSMFLFYSYGDDMYNAKHPGVMIFMSLKIEQNLDEEKRQAFLKGSKILTKFAEDYMFNLWSSYIKEDQLKPLFTRIANNVVLINLEN